MHNEAYHYQNETLNLTRRSMLIETYIPMRIQQETNICITFYETLRVAIYTFKNYSVW